MEDADTTPAKDYGPLHSLLVRACPPHDRRRSGPGKWEYFESPDGKFKSLPLLAAKLKMSAWGVQKWCHENHLPARRAAQIVDLNPEEVSLADFSPFVYM